MKFSLLVLVFTGLTIAGLSQDSTLKKEILGKYKFPTGSVVEEVTVAEEGGMLTMSSSVGTSALELVKGDSFNIVSFNGIAVFKRNDLRKVVGVHIDASGYVLDGVKDSVAVASKTMVFAATKSVNPAGALLADKENPHEHLAALQRRRIDKRLIDQ